MTGALQHRPLTELSEAPGGIARLRELVLALAVSGRLVDQSDSESQTVVFADRLAEYRML